MSKRFQVSAPLFDFSQLLSSPFHRNVMEMVIYQYSNCWVILSGSIALISLTGSITLMDILIDTMMFRSFFWVCRTIPTRRDTNLRAQLWGPRNSSMWSFPEEIYVNTCFFCAGGKRTIGLLLNKKAAVILDRAGGDPWCHTYLAYEPETVIYVPGIRG